MGPRRYQIYRSGTPVFCLPVLRPLVILSSKKLREGTFSGINYAPDPRAESPGANLSSFLFTHAENVRD